jgi:hypothetical protein
METQNNNQNKDEINKEETNQITTQKLAPTSTSTPTIIETSINTGTGEFPIWPKIHCPN